MELQFSEFARDEIEFLKQYDEYICKEIDQGLTETEKHNLFKLYVINRHTYGAYINKSECFRHILWAIEYATNNDKETAYQVAQAYLSCKKEGKHYYFMDLLLKMIKILGLEEEFEKQLDFVTLRATDYHEFQRRYCRGGLPYEELTDEEKAVKDKEKQDQEEFNKKCEQQRIEKTEGKGQVALF